MIDPSGHSFLDTVIANAVNFTLQAMSVINASLIGRTLFGAAVGGTIGCIQGALDSSSTCTQGFLSGILTGAIAGALFGGIGLTQFGQRAIVKVIFGIIFSGVAGAGAYSAA